MYIYVYMYTCIYVYMYIYIYVCMYIYIFVSFIGPATSKMKRTIDRLFELTDMLTLGIALRRLQLLALLDELIREGIH